MTDNDARDERREADQLCDPIDIDDDAADDANEDAEGAPAVANAFGEPDGAFGGAGEAQGANATGSEPTEAGAGEANATDEADEPAEADDSPETDDDSPVPDDSPETDGDSSGATDEPSPVPTESPDPDGDSPGATDEPSPVAYDFGEAETRLMALQQRARALKLPVVLLLEGWSAAGKGTMAGELLEGLDPRGYKVHVAERFSRDEDEYPDLRRYWDRMPRQGELALFIGGWYGDACAAAMRGKRGRRAFRARLERLNLMERMLVCDGALIIKFFIHISKKEQRKRLNALEQHKATKPRVAETDREQNERYDDWRALYNDMIAATDEPGAGWRVLPGKDKRECKRQLYTAVLSALEKAVAEREAGKRPWDAPALYGHEPSPVAHAPRLCDYDPAQALDEDYKQALGDAQKKLRALQYELYRRKIPMVLCFEGWDAAGKGGVIRRLTSAMDPRGFTVVPIAAPTAEEKEHHHLWRFWRALPKRGDIAIFDRTWYGRVMVERIEGFCTEAQWKRAYEEINLFERDLTDAGVIVRKFWLQISKDEQLKRFIARRDTPEKRWKITDEDWRNREKWPQYEQAVDEMLQKTNAACAPWIVVEADNKQYARLKALRAVIAAAEERLNKE